MINLKRLLIQSKELMQEKMNASQFEKDGLRVIVNNQNEVILQFHILNDTFQLKDKSISDISRYSFGNNSAQYIHSKIMSNKPLKSKIQMVVNDHLKNRIVTLMKEKVH